MSWSTSTIISKNTHADDLYDILTDLKPAYGSEAPEQQKEAFHAAVVAVVDIIGGGSITPIIDDKLKYSVSVTMNGHTNSGHEPKLGWANDCVSISVSQLKDS